jgi:hypothetical protein
MATFLSLTPVHVESATRARIKTLALEIAESYSLLKVKEKIQTASRLLRYLRALQADPELINEERTAIYQVLIKLGELYHIPTAPTVTANRVVNILFGQSGNDGPAGPPGPAGTGFPYFENNDVAVPQEIVDAFPTGESNGCRWDYYAIGAGPGEGMRGGSIIAVWNAADAVTYYEHQSGDLGGITTPLTFSVDISGGNVRLLASVSTSNWIIRGARYQMQDLIL